MIEQDIQDINKKLDLLEEKINSLIKLINPSKKKFMSVKDASKEFGVGQQSIRNYIARYPLEIKTTYIAGRVLIETESLMNLLENHAIKASIN